MELSVDWRPAISRSVITRDDLITKLMSGPLRARATAQVRKGERAQGEGRERERGIRSMTREIHGSTQLCTYPDKRVYR